MKRPATEDQFAADLAATRQAAMDDRQGWYQRDTDRMRRSLHPELAKRANLRDPQTGEECFHHVSRQQMGAKTRQDCDA